MKDNMFKLINRTVLFSALATAFCAHAAKPAAVAHLSSQAAVRGASGSAAEIVGLAGSDLKAVRSISYPNGKTVTRYEQYYKGVPLWDEFVVEHRTPGKVNHELTGKIVRDIANDLPSVKPVYSAADALLAAKTKAQKFNTERDEAKLFVKIDKKNVARLVYLVSFIVKDSKQPSRPHFIVDANNGVVLEQWEGMHFFNATGPGGNVKTGKYEFGTNYGYLNVNDNCEMITTDPVDRNTAVITVNYPAAVVENQLTKPYKFTCPRNTDGEINGGYSVFNDAHFFGNAMHNMFRDWYQIRMIPGPLVLHTNRGDGNAYWDGSYLQLGRGDSETYPFTTIDVIGHEAAHAFTQNNSNLLGNFGESGAINEAFSDMAGEALESYIKGANDFKGGAELMKNKDAKRYLDNPPRDGSSRDNYYFYDLLDRAHINNGIYNKAFYLLATKPGWTTRKAFQVMVDANRVYWSRGTTFSDGACGVEQAAFDRGYSKVDVTAAFNSVGVVCGTHRMVVEQLYVGHFGRPADANGLVNMANALKSAGAPTDIYLLNQAYDSNPTIKSLIDSFGTSSESLALHGSSDNTTFVQNLYRYMFNREPDSQGLSYWVNAINSGSVTRGRAGMAIMAGASRNYTSQGLIDWETANRKSAVAQYFTIDLDTSTEIAAYSGSKAAATARSMLANVTNTTDINGFQSTVKTTISQIVAGQ